MLARESLSFKQRIRPGMVIRWSPPSDFTPRKVGANYAVILCPASALETPIRDVTGKEIVRSIGVAAASESGREKSSSRKYLCSIMKPGAMLDSYEVMLWQQVVIDEEEMEGEVLMEYDGASRYYGVTV